MSDSIQVTLLLPFAVLVLLAALQWSLLLWAKSTAMAAAQNSTRVAVVLGGSTENGREVGRRALFNSAFGNAIMKVDRVAVFMIVVVEGTVTRVLPMVDTTVHQAAKMLTERIRRRMTAFPIR